VLLDGIVAQVECGATTLMSRAMLESGWNGMATRTVVRKVNRTLRMFVPLVLPRGWRCTRG
jgi:hypothetical protein